MSGLIGKGQPHARPQLLYCGAIDDYALLLRHVLESAGFAVLLSEPRRLLHDSRPAQQADAVILGDAAMLRAEAALAAVAAWRRPVLVLIDAAAAAADIAVWRQAGFMLWPRIAPPAELIALLRARIHGGHGAERLHYADIELDLASCRIFRGGREIRLGPIEFRLLQLFLSDPHRVFSRQQLAQTGWPGQAYVAPRTVDVHIAHLRRALNTAGAPRLLRTVRGLGYALA